MESHGDSPPSEPRPQPLNESTRHQDDAIWPVVPSFRDWQFPHNTFESVKWHFSPDDTEPSDRPSTAPDTDAESTSNVNTAAPPQPSAPPPNSQLMPPPRTGRRPKADQVRRCAISGTAYGLQRGHCIPAAEDKWFKQNGMENCGLGNNSITNNRITVRHDLHQIWDGFKFALVPKRGRFVVHGLFAAEARDCEFAAAWHNKPVNAHELLGKPEEYLFAKFTQAILILLKPFITSVVRRRVAKLQTNLDSEGREESFVVNTQWLSGAQLEEAYSGGGSRSASASSNKKRSRSQQAGADDSDGDDDDDDWYERNIRRRWARGSSEEDEIAETWYQNMLAAEEKENQGRPRERRPRPDINDSTDADIDKGKSQDHAYQDLPHVPCDSGELDPRRTESDAHSAEPVAATDTIIISAT